MLSPVVFHGIISFIAFILLPRVIIAARLCFMGKRCKTYSTWNSSTQPGKSKGAKKGTPFAASKVGDLIGSKAYELGVKDADVVVRGVGSGREPAIRAFMAHGIEVTSIKDATPIPHNGPKAKKPRRV